MKGNASFGVYRPRDSFAHRLDPACKIGFVFFFLLSCMLASGVRDLLCITLVCVIMCAVSKTGFKDAVRSVRPLLAIMICVALYNIFCIGSGSVLFVAGPLRATTGGVFYAVSSLVRMSVACIGSQNLMATTSATELTDGLARLLAPLRSLGMSVDDLVFAMGATFRFVPCLTQEYRRIKTARKERGAAATNCSVYKKIQDLTATLYPLCMSVFLRSDTLAHATYNRGYGCGSYRSCIRSYEVKRIDVAVVVCGVCVFLLCICL